MKNYRDLESLSILSIIQMNATHGETETIRPKNCIELYLNLCSLWVDRDQLHLPAQLPTEFAQTACLTLVLFRCFVHCLTDSLYPININVVRTQKIASCPATIGCPIAHLLFGDKLVVRKTTRISHNP